MWQHRRRVKIDRGQTIRNLCNLNLNLRQQWKSVFPKMFSALLSFVKVVDVSTCLPLYYSVIRMKMIVNSEIDRGRNLDGFNVFNWIQFNQTFVVPRKMIIKNDQLWLSVAMALATIVFDNTEIIGEPIIYRARFLKIRSMPYSLQALSIPCFNYQRQEKKWRTNI